MKKKLFVVSLIMVMCLVALVVGVKLNIGGNKYYIKKPNNMNQITVLEGKEANSVIEYMSKVLDWYNKIDISKPVDLDIIMDNELIEMWSGLIELEKMYIIEKQNQGVRHVDDPYEVATEMGYKISKIMQESKINASIDSEGNYKALVSIDEEKWKELQDSIVEAKEFYYTN